MHSGAVELEVQDMHDHTGGFSSLRFLWDSEGHATPVR